VSEDEKKPACLSAAGQVNADQTIIDKGKLLTTVAPLAPPMPSQQRTSPEWATSHQ
jgi:hypothetical protein